MSEPPNVLVIVMDCVRAQDFPGGTGSEVDRMPFVESLRKESVVFERAVAPASWTVPSHASLFTGLYPWENGIHAHQSLRLPRSLPTLPDLLRPLGYRSLALSGNPMLDRSFGLIDSFDTADWADWWEPFLRLQRATKPEASHTIGRPEPRETGGPLPGFRKILLNVSPHILRFPYVMDATTRIAQRIREPAIGHRITVAPWIEPTLAEWARLQPSDHPIFGFINLIDAHEPYYTDTATVRRLVDWLRYARVRQDHFGYALGEWMAAAEGLALLHRLYRRMIELMDRRIEEIVGILKASGRWENTLLVLTSDHGQGFGEHGVLFHTLRIDEGEVRIPLWVRFPRGEHGGVTAQGWASLVDVAPTVLQLVDAPGPQLPSAVPLTSLIHQERPNPVLTVGDGLTWPHIQGRIRPDQRERIDRLYVGCYEGSTKTILDVESGAIKAFDIDTDPMESRGLQIPEDGSSSSRISLLRSVGERLRSATPQTTDADINERLKTWGYL